MLKVGVAVHGVEAILAEDARRTQPQLPIRVDPYTVITEVEAEGKTMVTTTLVEDATWTISDEQIAQNIGQLCEDARTRWLLMSEAVIVNKLVLPDNSAAGEVVVQEADCKN